ncbi:flagellar biosynthesis anti-sigma factor FlgM [Halopseudomonas pelagia]|uniref:flagellar biosynthesis anti-sigma factor FlgM n=1 Tax=Halopseudomonas pelagia TaxID=553151 RepID=UPI00039FFDD3|nr:flagellar biosynthesis anti-sigma factor FlgM [Halopseudomonas pelagia]|tara:strand:+ start:619 stop:930 length:312 start_codon:yes stop_codon:yes gene_type:complete
MVIDFNTSNSAGRSAQSSAASAKRDATEAARPAEQTAADQAVSAESGVKLSSQAQQLQAIEERIRDLPEVDSARVAQIRQAISDGSYQTDSARIADKLLALEE